MCKLATMRWRYGIVGPGENPRDAAITVLSQAQELIDAMVANSSGSASRLSGVMWHAMPRSSPADATPSQSLQALRADVLMGLAVTRLIYNGKDRSEDGIIEAQLSEVLHLRESARDSNGVADALNSIGMLKQKQQAFGEAEGHFLKSLELRCQLRSDGQHAIAKAQALAQVHTSLANLYKEWNHEGGDGQAGRNLVEEALTQYEKAQVEYIRGFHARHPKVANAVEGIASLQQQQGKLVEALIKWQETEALLPSDAANKRLANARAQIESIRRELLEAQLLEATQALSRRGSLT